MSSSFFPVTGSWIYFILFTVGTGVLSEISFPWPIQGVIFLIFIVLPFLGGIGRGVRVQDEAGPQEDWLPAVPFWFWVLALTLAIWLRFYRLGGVWGWPNLDEGMLSSAAIDLSEKWDWKFFYTFGQAPPLPVWTSGILLKLGMPPLLCLWVPSATVTLCTLGFGYAAARRFSTRTLSTLFAFLLAFSAWPLWMGRLCHEGVWVPLWTMVCLYLLAGFHSARAGLAKRQAAILLGLAAGLGYFTFTPWPVVVPLLASGAFANIRPWGLRNKDCLLYFLIPFFLALMPFFILIYRNGFGDHIASVFFLSGWFPLKHQTQTMADYLTAIFGGATSPDAAYTIPGGGVLNPLLDGAFFLGLLWLIRERARGWAAWLLVCLGATLLPGLLSMNVEMFRIAQALPFLLWTTALGLSWLSASLPRKVRLPILLLILTAVLGMDVGRVFRAIPDRQNLTDAEPSLRAQTLLESVAHQWGPGLVFTELNIDSRDHASFVATYAFNAAENPRLRSDQARWAAIFTNSHYLPFLFPRFPQARWYRLGADSSSGETLLGMIPLDSTNRKTLDLWVRADHYFHLLNLRTDAISGEKTYQEADQAFQEMPVFLAQDRFLESCYWERRGDFYYDYRYQTHLEDHLNALRQAIRQGYPAAHLYFKLGSLLLRKGDRREAKAAFRSALRADPHYEAAQVGLNMKEAINPREVRNP